MNFFNFLTENLSLLDVETCLKHDCRKFIYDIDIPVFRGVNVAETYDFRELSKVYVRTDRQPVGSSPSLHRFLNIGLESATGISGIRSSSVFCSFDARFAKSYGKLAVIFPIDDYDVISSEIIVDAFVDTVYLVDSIFSKLKLDDVLRSKHARPGSNWQDAIIELLIWIIDSDKKHSSILEFLADDENLKNPFIKSLKKIISSLEQENVKKLLSVFNFANRRMILEIIQETFHNLYDFGNFSTFNKKTWSSELMVQCRSYYVISYDELLKKLGYVKNQNLLNDVDEFTKWIHKMRI